MRLKSLELIGFKSFADRTEFVFDEDVTVIVGPNGCGKSNLVDAVKWILGEQNPRTLRGNEMSDLIFNGNGERGSMGYAEASLVLKSATGKVPVDSDEIVVTRRLYRSGDSEYLLNNQLCRLRDIRELFMDTGMGVDWYSVVEQGRIDALVSARPEDRRRIFEEAAGISRYKAKRKEATAKLERVEQNLARVSDIISEVERQLHSVKVQAGRARSYRECSEQLRASRIRLAVHEYDALLEAREGMAMAIRELEERREATRARVAGLRETAAGIEAALARVQKDVSDAEARIMVLESEKRAQLEKSEVSQRRIEETEASMREQSGLASEFEERRRTAAQRREEEAVALAECEKEVADAGKEVEESSRRIELMRAELARLRSEAEQSKGTLLELAQEKARLQNEISSVVAELRVLEARERRLKDRGRAITAEMASLAERKAGFAAERDALESELRRTQEALSHKTLARSALEQEIAALKAEAMKFREELTALSSRESLLSDMEQRLEGVQVGVKTVLEEAQRAGTSLRGILGVLGMLFDVDVKFAAAFEGLLGEKAQVVVTETASQAMEAISFLKSKNLGPVSFLPLELLGDGSQPTQESDSLLKLLSCDVRLKAALARLVGDAQIVENLEEGLRLRATSPGRRCVTLNGDTVEPSGIVRAGGGGSVGIVRRRSELHSLRDRIGVVNANVTKLAENTAERERERDHLADEEEDLRSRLRAQQATLNEKLGQIAAISGSERELVEERDVIGSELGELRDTFEAAAACRDRQAQEMAQLEGRQQAVEEAIRGSEAKRDENERLIGEITQVETQARVKLAKLQEKNLGLKRSIGELEARLAEYARAAAEATDRARTCETRCRELSEEKRLAESEAEKIALEIARFARLVETNRTASDSLRANVEGNQAELESTGAALEGLEGELQDGRLHLKERELEMTNLTSRVRDEYQEELARLHEGYQREDTDWTAVREQIRLLEERLRRIGVVNLDAIREQEELEARQSFLTVQREDLVKARESTLDTIRRLNARSRELFRETLERIRVNFQETFRKLFGGGRADITVDETVDILEAEIEITVRPPGKAPCSISLLSGGEKALVGVGLLFAVLQAKACPFCVLDEVDAALDETNIDRFSNLLRELAGRSQFIVVTHSRRTMSVADLLYGITMQESGVSKKVSVKFQGPAKQAPETTDEDAGTALGLAEGQKPSTPGQ